MSSEAVDVQQAGTLVGGVCLILGIGIAVVLILLCVEPRPRNFGAAGLGLVLVGFYGPSLVATFLPLGVFGSGGFVEWLVILPFALIQMGGFFCLARAVAASGRSRRAAREESR